MLLPLRPPLPQLASPALLVILPVCLPAALQVLLVLAAIRAKEEQLSSQRAVLETLTGLEDAVQVQLRELEGENKNLRQELERLEAQNNNLQASKHRGVRIAGDCGTRAQEG